MKWIMKQCAMGSTLSLWLVVIMVEGVFQREIQPATTSKPESWTGRWLPEHKTPSLPHNLDDPKHGVRMGVVSHTCDDAKTNLTVDWDNSPVNYTCYDYAINYKPKWTTKAIVEYENIPKYYSAQHKCMDQKISYSSKVPTFGTHRPLWPVYGEYKFVPAQRWIHTLEHGGIVMLYHPCANKIAVKLLRHLVTNCLRRHVITPYTLLTSERPLALVAWGVRLEMSTVESSIVESFIKKHALRGPEAVSREGQYQYGLMNSAAIVSDFDDTILCPHS